MKEFDIIASEICENLQSSDRCNRQVALKKLEEFFESDEATTDEIISIYDDCYLHVLKCYSDKYESCRESSCNVITAAIKKLPKNDYYLQYVIGILTSRLGKKEIIETSEEMRLVLMHQLNFMIDRFRSPLDADKKQDKLLKSYNEIIDILLKTLTDDFPAVQKEACKSIKLLSECTSSFHYRAEALTKPLFPLLCHKHSQTRILAIESLGIICLHIFSNYELMVKIMVDMSPSLMDTMPLVRLECGKVGVKWLLDLRDRYSYFERILPLVLCCLKDDSPEVRDYIKPLWAKCGKQFYYENENELSKLEVADEIPQNYPKDVERPTIGCRGLVQKALRMVHLIMQETSDWKDEVRLHSLKLLYQFVLHTEHSLTIKFFEIYADLSRACADSVKLIANEALKVSDLMGRLLLYNTWINHGIEGLEKHPKLGFLKCFYAIYSSSIVNNVTDVLKIAKILALSDFCHSLQPAFQEYLLKMCVVLITKSNKSDSAEIPCETNSLKNAMENLSISNSSEEIERYLYHIIIKVMCLSFEDRDQTVYELGKETLLRLAKNDENEIKILHHKHLNSVLETFDSLDAELDGNTEPILLLHGVIRICGFQNTYLICMKECILTVWNHALPEGKIKIFSAISIAMLKWDETMNLSDKKTENLEILHNFVDEIVKPQIQWKAGASAESMRSFATATLCSMAEGAKNEAPQVLANLATYFPSLLEDKKVATRCYALKCFMNFGEVDLDNLKPIIYGILQRFDDPCSEIREWAARTISFIASKDFADNETSLLEMLLKYTFDMLFLHFDGPELKLKSIIKESLIEIGKKHPDIFHDKYQEALKNSTSKDELIEIQALVVN